MVSEMVFHFSMIGRENGNLTLQIFLTDFPWKEVLLQVLKNGTAVPPPGQRVYLQVRNHLTTDWLKFKVLMVGGD